MTESDLLQALRDNPFVLAPMASITDKPFRTYMRGLGTGIVISELVSANGIRYGGDKTFKLMEYDERERPVGIQLFGENLENLEYAAKVVEDRGADFIDMNFGCPVKKVVQKGAGSAILKDLVQLKKVLRTMKSAVSIPVTIKIRTGWDQNQRNADQVTQVAYDEGITWVAIHGRTRSQGYSGDADWDYIKQIKAQSPLPVLGNGDITSPELAVERLKESGCDGVMVGRGCLKNPWLFLEALDLYKEKVPTRQKSFVPLIESLAGELQSFHDTRTVMIQLRKFAMWYSSGYPGSAQFRKTLFSTATVQETLQKTLEYYQKLDHGNRIDTSREAFLMGGHG